MGSTKVIQLRTEVIKAMESSVASNRCTLGETTTIRGEGGFVPEQMGSFAQDAEVPGPARHSALAGLSKASCWRSERGMNLRGPFLVDELDDLRH